MKECCLAQALTAVMYKSHLEFRLPIWGSGWWERHLNEMKLTVPPRKNVYDFSDLSANHYEKHLISLIFLTLLPDNNNISSVVLYSLRCTFAYFNHKHIITAFTH